MNSFVLFFSPSFFPSFSPYISFVPWFLSFFSSAPLSFLSFLLLSIHPSFPPLLLSFPSFIFSFIISSPFLSTLQQLPVDLSCDPPSSLLIWPQGQCHFILPWPRPLPSEAPPPVSVTVGSVWTRFSGGSAASLSFRSDLTYFYFFTFLKRVENSGVKKTKKFQEVLSFLCWSCWIFNFLMI